MPLPIAAAALVPAALNIGRGLSVATKAAPAVRTALTAARGALPIAARGAQALKAGAQMAPQMRAGLSTLAQHGPKLRAGVQTLAQHGPTLRAGLSTFAKNPVVQNFAPQVLDTGAAFVQTKFKEHTAGRVSSLREKFEAEADDMTPQEWEAGQSRISLAERMAETANKAMDHGVGGANQSISALLHREQKESA